MSERKKPKAIILDWDDTLVDTWPVVFRSVNTAIAAMGGQPWTEEEARQRIGPPAKVLFTALFGEDKWQEADKIYIKAYEDNIAAHLRKHALVPEILDAMKQQCIPLFVVSAKRGYLLRKEAAALGLDGYFSGVVGVGDATNDKPHIDATLLALKGTGIDPGPDVWFVGDGITDLLAARNSGCTAVLIETKLPSAEKLAQTPPDLRFKTHAELLSHIETWKDPAPKPPDTGPARPRNI